MIDSKLIKMTLNHWAERKIKEEMVDDYLKDLEKKREKQIVAPIHKSFWILLTSGTNL